MPLFIFRSTRFTAGHCGKVILNHTKSSMPSGRQHRANLSDREALQNLYDIARKERTFEITQLVQRNNFVMIFQGVLFAGYLQASANKDLPQKVAFIVCIVGLCTALAQYWLAAGAKFWQERWEIEVERIERKLEVMWTEDQQRSQWFPLFTQPISDVEREVRRRMSGKLFGSTIAGRWSPSRLPIFVALVFFLAWGVLAVTHLEIKPGIGINFASIGAADKPGIDLVKGFECEAQHASKSYVCVAR